MSSSKWIAAFVAASAVAFGVAIANAADRAPAQDSAFWTYTASNGTTRHGDAVSGTPETIAMPGPQPLKGETVTGITHVVQSPSASAYPLHVSMIEKAFSNAYGVDFYKSEGKMLYKYDAAAPFSDEVSSVPRAGFKMAGPYLAASGKIPADYQPAFIYVKAALISSSLPAAQKDITHYAVLFIQTNDTIWTETAPLPAAGEALHLGCQMQNGRDMVFAYNTKDKSPGPSIACF